MNKKALGRMANNILAPLGLLAVLAATIVPFFLRYYPLAQAIYPYVYTAGALLVLVARTICAGAADATDLRLRRLHRMEVWIGIIFCVAAFFLFYPGASPRDWLAFTLAGAALQIYTSLAIPAREARIAKENKE